MLRKFNEKFGAESGPFVSGASVYIVMRDGTMREGYFIQSCLMDLVSLDRSPLDDSEKQGFTISGDQLLPNWCEGKRQIVAAWINRDRAEQMAADLREKLAVSGRIPKVRTPHKGCEN